MPISSRPRKSPDSLAAFALLATLGGCDLDWQKPDVSAPPPPRFREAKPASAPSLGSARDFTARFGSRELSGVVDQALENNYDIAAAVARIAQADAQARVSSSALWPALTMNNSAQRNQIPGTEFVAQHGRRRGRHVVGHLQRKRLRDPI